MREAAAGPRSRRAEPSPQPRAPSPQPRSAPHLRGAGSRRSCPRPAPCQLLGERRPATPRPGQVRAPRPRGAGEGGERPPAPPQAGTRRGLSAPSLPGPAGVALSVFTAFLVLFFSPPHGGPAAAVLWWSRAPQVAAHRRVPALGLTASSPLLGARLDSPRAAFRGVSLKSSPD